jgi:hypothetical protein
MTNLAQQALAWKAALMADAQGIPEDCRGIPALRADWI